MTQDRDRITDYPFEEFLGIDIIENENLPVGTFVPIMGRDMRGESYATKVVMHPYDLDVLFATDLDGKRIDMDMLIAKRTRRLTLKIAKQAVAAVNRIDGLVGRGEANQLKRRWRVEEMLRDARKSLDTRTPVSADGSTT